MYYTFVVGFIFKGKILFEILKLKLFGDHTISEIMYNIVILRYLNVYKHLKLLNVLNLGRVWSFLTFWKIFKYIQSVILYDIWLSTYS